MTKKEFNKMHNRMVKILTGLKKNSKKIAQHPELAKKVIKFCDKSTKKINKVLKSNKRT